MTRAARSLRPRPITTAHDDADRLTEFLPGAGPNPFTGLTYDSHGSIIVTMGDEVQRRPTQRTVISSRRPRPAHEMRCWWSGTRGRSTTAMSGCVIVSRAAAGT